ncbi:hypothetical protein GCM10022295_07680 [Streptomyces osmaniensis]|uniref:Uncharacterized protein n=2 Tax=Streptomyces osmaniensis TaxID=593134 RepID=A0ABP6V6D1_9ACTN
MLPSREIDLAYPTWVDSPEDPELHMRWLFARNSHGHSLRDTLMALRLSHGIDVRVSLRALPFTPMAELYIVNSAEVLFSYCTVTRRGTDPVTREIYDVAPTGMSMLGRFQATTAGDRDAIFVEQSLLWFDSLWNTISTDLTLS